MLLSEYFYDAERLEPEIQDKLQAVLKDWQGVFLDGKGTTKITCRQNNSAIHKATGSLVTGRCLQNGKNATSRNNPQILFRYSLLHGFSGIVPVKSWNGREP